MNEQYKRFLKDFEGFQVVLYPHKSMKTEITNINISRSLDEVMELNQQYPSNLYFTPNFQYNNTNKIDSKLDLSDANADPQGFPCAFVFDFNATRFEGGKEEYLAYIKNIMETRLVWKYKYIVETQNGFHVYFVIDKNARRAVNLTYWESFTKITDYIARQLGANCDKKVIERKGAVFRLPWSYYRHLSDMIEVRIIEETTSNLSLEDVGQVASYINDMSRAERDERAAYKKLWVTSYQKILDVTLEEVIRRVNKPELFEWAIIDPELKIIVGKIGDNLKEKPSGSPYQILWHLCSWDPSAASTMLNKIFDISDSIIPWLDAIQTHSIEGKGYSIKFMLGMVQLTQLAPNQKGEYTEKTKVIFRNNIRVLGKGYITSSSMGESNIPRLAVIIDVDGTERVINQMPSKGHHNKAYTDLFFYGDDNDLGLFFNGIIEDQDIPHIDVYERSWYYDTDVVFWDGLIIGDGEFSRVLLGENEFSTVKDVEQISVYEYFNQFKECYKEEFSVPLFLSAVALGGMNLWNRLEVNPAVLVSGETGCGKSTVAALLKKMLGYDTHAREMALPSISPQPLKQLASDNAILFLEELTQKVWPQTEELLRNIVNRDKAARGTLDWTVWWNFRSPLWVNGERTFKDESLNNRFCGFIMSQDYWMPWGAESINKLEKYTAYKDIYSIFLNSRDYINDQLLQYKYKLLDQGFPSRACDVWAYMFTVNDVFNFGYDFEELVGYVRIHLTKTGLWDKKSKDPIGSFTKLISTSIINKKMSLIINNSRRIKNQPYIIVSLLFLDPDIYQQTRGKLYSSIADINDTLTENTIEIDDTSISFYILDKRDRNGFVDEDSKIIGNVTSDIIEMLPTNITNTIRGIHHYDRW